MSTLSPGQIAVAMLACGWKVPFGIQVYEDGTQKVVDEKAKNAAIKFYDTAIAVCLAESGGNTNAKNPNSNARGLWQIMTSVHEDMIKQVQSYWVSELGTDKVPTIMHPLVNTECAHRLYNESKWQPWEAYNTGAYKAFLGKGEAAYKAVTNPKNNAGNIKALVEEFKLGQETAQVIGSIVAGGLITNNDLVTNTVGTVLEFLKDAGATIGVFILGAILLILGAWFLLSRTSVGKGIKTVAKKASPVT